MKTACPQPQDLRQFVLGNSPEPQSAYVEEHLQGCGSCVETLHALKLDDTLVRAVKAQSSAVELPDLAAAEQLADRLARMVEPWAVGNTEISGHSEESAAYSFLTPSGNENELGRLGAYRVVKLVGEGGMGMVFEAEDTRLMRTVALKLMKPELAKNDRHRQRFLREARAAAAVEHDHLVPIYQVDEDQGVVFFAMQFLKGETLAERLAREGKVPIDEVLRISGEIAEGLAAAHGHGLIHRDIKPMNIWLESDRGRVKIVDFGLARIASDSTHLTLTGTIMGTPEFMAPEQARGEDVDGRCDLFSLGCIMYCMCTGAAPFKGDNPLSVLTALAVDHPKPPRQVNPNVPAELSNLIERLLSKKPEDRSASAREVIEALEKIKQARAGSPTAPALHRRRLFKVVAFAAAVLLVAVGIRFAPTIIRIATDKGTVVIEGVDEDIKVEITKGGTQIKLIDLKTKKEIDLQSGEYQIALAEGKPGLKLSTDRFTIVRGKETEPIRVERFEPIAEPKVKVPGTIKEYSAFKALPAMPDDLKLEFKDVRRFEGHERAIRGLSFAPDGRRFVSGSRDRTARIWDSTTGKEEQCFKGHTAFVDAAAFCPDGKHVLSAGGSFWDGEKEKKDPQDFYLRLWEVESGKQLHQFDEHITRPHTEKMKFNDVWALAVSPDGKYAVCGGMNRRLWLWDLNTRKFVLKFRGEDGRDDERTWTVAFSPDGKKVASAGQDKAVRLWDVATGKLQVRLLGHDDFVRAIAFSPDGKTLFCGDLAGKMRLWNLDAGTAVQFPSQPTGFSTAAFTPDGRCIITANGAEVKNGGNWGTARRDLYLRLFDASNGQKVGQSILLEGMPISVAVAPAVANNASLPLRVVVGGTTPNNAGYLRMFEIVDKKK